MWTAIYENGLLFTFGELGINNYGQLLERIKKTFVSKNIVGEGTYV